MSHSTRRSVVYARLIALFAIAGMMAYVVAFGMGASAPSFSMPESHNVAFSNSTIAPIDAGAAPSVTIHDPKSKVYVSTSTDAKIHIANVVETRGWHFGISGGSSENLVVAHTGTDVKIERPHSSGHVSAHAGDGTVRVTGTNGDLDIKAGGGRIYLTNVHAKRVVAHSFYGRLVLNDVTTEQLDADTRDGRVLVDGLKMVGDAPRAVLATQSGSMTVTATFPANGTYTLRTADGHVRLRLPPTSNLTVTATTGDGGVTADSAFTTSGFLETTGAL